MFRTAAKISQLIMSLVAFYLSAIQIEVMEVCFNLSVVSSVWVLGGAFYFSFIDISLTSLYL